MLAKTPTLAQQITEARERGQRLHDEWLVKFADGYLRNIASATSALQREHQADHIDALADHELRVGQRTT